MMLVERDLGEVPTTVIYSKTDGVVHWGSCLDRSGAKTVENIEVMASHVGMGVNTEVFRVVAERLARDPRPTSAPRATSVVRLMRRRDALRQLS